jgi:hypothetical protein
VEADAVVSRARGPTGFELAGGGVGLTGAWGAGARRRRVALVGAALEHGLSAADSAAALQGGEEHWNGGVGATSGGTDRIIVMARSMRCRHRVHRTVVACATRTSFYRSYVAKNLGLII